jgi:oligopeptide/dipeptide ABC transporter ATP-binding protein
MHSFYDCVVATLLEVTGLTVELATLEGWIRPVDDVSFSMEEGEVLGVAGESGSGKTMLALALMGLLPKGACSTGEVKYHAREFSGEDGGDQLSNLLTCGPAEMRALRGRELALIFQEPLSAMNPVMRVGAQISEAIRVHEPTLTSADANRRMIEAMRKAAIPEPERRSRQFPHQLSGGLRQRAMIAMALAAGPRLLIADEPTAALDATIQNQILDLLARLRDELHLAILFISHDLGAIGEIADRLCVMYAGRIVEEGRTGEVLCKPLHPYAEGLLRAAPRIGVHPSSPIPGNAPKLNALPPGCSFAPRCGWHRNSCDAAVPALRPTDAEHQARCILV